MIVHECNHPDVNPDVGCAICLFDEAEKLRQRHELHAWARAGLAVVALTGAIVLAIAQKDELRGLLISDISGDLKAEQAWSLTCQDGTRGTFIGSAIHIEGCDIQPTDRFVPVR